jgi:PPIC-type PPIASE domain
MECGRWMRWLAAVTAAVALALVVTEAGARSGTAVTVTAPAATTTVSVAQLDHWMRVALLSNRIRQQVIAPAAAGVTDAQVDAAGATWAVVARRYSIDAATRRHGGLQRRVLRSELERPLAKAVFRAPLHRLRGPVRTQFGYYVFEVVRVRPRSVMPVARQRALIRARLIIEAQQATLDAFVTAFEAKWRARTMCAPAYTWEPDCVNSR